jgi:hypothetical protein
MSGKYILNGHKPIPCDDIIKWGKWFETGERTVAKDTIDNILISTVFLGLDHSFGNRGLLDKPVLFETMIFGGEHDQYQDRYTSWEDAKKGHQKALKLVKKSISGQPDEAKK